MIRRALAAVLFATLLASGASADDESSIEVRAQLAPDPIGLDELAVLSLTIEAKGVGLPRVEPGFLLDNLEGSGGPSRSQSTSWVNGESSSRLELTWRLRPVAVGRARVHAVRVQVGAQIKSLPDLAIEVLEKAPPGRPAPRSGPAPADPFARLFEDDPFGIFPRRRSDVPVVQPKLALRSLLAPATAWMGEQVVWTLALDTQTDITGFRPNSLPDFAGFWTREIDLPQPPRPEWIEVDGEKFGRVAMMARALFALRPGELEIDRVPVDVVARMPGDDWIGGGLLRRDRPLDLVARPVRLRVRPLPAAPAGFSGVVGSSSIEATLDPPRVVAGQAATLRVRLTTTGNPHGLAPPQLDLPPGLRGFPPETTRTERFEDGRLRSEVEWRYVVLPNAAGVYDLPPLAWTYFDPASATYSTLATLPAHLKVEVAPASTRESPAEPDVRESPPADLPPVTRTAHIGWGIAGGLAVVAALFWLARRRRPETRQLRIALEAARSVASSRDAARAIDDAWRRLLAERYGLGRGTPLAQWPAALGAAGWRIDRIDELRRLFEEIQLLEFAPELADADALRRDVDQRSRDLARRLP